MGLNVEPISTAGLDAAHEILVEAGAATWDDGMFVLTDPFGWRVAHACAWEIGESRLSPTQVDAFSLDEIVRPR